MKRQFQQLFERHGNNVRQDARFNVGEGWQHLIQQASAALLRLETKVLITGADVQDGCLMIGIDIEGENAEAHRKASEIVDRTRLSSLTVCEACGKHGTMRDGLDRVRCEEHADVLPLKQAAAELGTTPFKILHVIDVTDLVPSVMILNTGELWDRGNLFGFTSADIALFREEFGRRHFKLLREHHGNIVPAEAKFDCGPGWENILLHLADKLGQLPGPPMLTGGKQKFGCLVSYVDYDNHGPNYEAVEALRKNAREKSLTVCEECGQSGRLRMGLQIVQTTCDKHAHLVGTLSDDDGKFLDCWNVVEDDVDTKYAAAALSLVDDNGSRKQ